MWLIGGDWRHGFLSRGDEFTCIIKKGEIEDVYFVSVREVLQGSTCVCHEDRLGWNSCFVMYVDLLSLKKSEYIYWGIYIEDKWYYLKRKRQESYSFEKYEKILSCFWKNLESKFWLSIQGGLVSMKKICLCNEKKSWEIFVWACVSKPLLSLFYVRCWCSCWRTFKMLEDWSLDSKRV